MNCEFGFAGACPGDWLYYLSQDFHGPQAWEELSRSPG